MASTDSRPVPIKNTAYRLQFGIFKSDGTLITGAAGLDSEVSKDSGTFADCTSEATEIATSSGVYYLDLTSTEMNADSVTVLVKSSSTGAVPVVISLYPQESGDIKVDIQSLSTLTLPVGSIPAFGIIENGTMQSGSTSSTAVLRSATSFADDLVNNTVLEITGGTGVGQVRMIVDYTGATDTATVNPNWTTTPDNTSTYIIRAAAPAPTSSTYYPTITADAAGIRSAIGLASANLDTQLSTIDDFLDTEVAAIKAKTDQLTFTVANQVDSNAITVDEDEILDDQLTDSVPADGTLPTVRQALYMLTQFMFERSVSGTTLTVRKADGSTSLMTFTLSDATSPTSITRAT